MIEIMSCRHAPVKKQTADRYTAFTPGPISLYIGDGND